MPNRWALLLAAAVATAALAGDRPWPDAVPSARAVPASGLACPAAPAPLEQEPDGRFSGCLRVGALPTGPATVWLELDRANTGGTGPGLGPRALLTLSPTSGPPGTRVVIHGTTPDHRSLTTDDLPAALCWNGCGSRGLIEQGVPFRWTTPHTFVATLTVPTAPWLGADAVQPLVSGPYAIGVQCLLVLRGCGLAGAEGTAVFTLRAPPRGRCTPGQPCATLSVHPAAAAPASLVRVSGWAPIASVIGRPFGLQIGLRSGRPPRRPSSAPTISGPGLSQYRLAPTPLRIAAPRSWASLRPIRAAAILAGGMSPIAEQPGASGRVAWCAPGVIRVRGGGPTRIPVAGVAAALRVAGVPPLAGARGQPIACQAVALDAHDRATVYAAFAVGSEPPVALAALVTTDAGARWRLVPPPAGSAPTGFGGFRQVGGATGAVFLGAATGRPGSPPIRSTTSADGGRRWTAGGPDCPAAGPCVTLGAFVGGDCAMNGEAQAVLRGTPSGAGRDRQVLWTEAGWVAAVNPCTSAQLVATRNRGALLIGGGSPYLVLRSTLGGRGWAAVGLPRPPAAGAGLGLPEGGGLLFLPNGALLDTAGAAPGAPARWALLLPGRRHWCLVPRARRAPVRSFWAGSSSPGSTRRRWPTAIRSRSIRWR